MARRSKFKIGSREAGVAARDILHALELAREPLNEKELAKRLRVPRSEREAFERALDALERAGDLVRNRAGSLLVAKRIAVLLGFLDKLRLFSAKIAPAPLPRWRNW